jgi:hypothetical protein
LQTQLITFTTDFGSTDGSVALLKLHIGKALPEAAFNDISHNIAPLQIGHAAYLIKNLYPHFAAKTLHLILVNTHLTINNELLLAKCDEQFFLAPNNGIFNWLFQNKNVEYRLISTLHNENGFYKNIAEAIVTLFNSENFETIGKAITLENKYSVATVAVDENFVRGRIWLIDDFGNLITNIHHDLLNPLITNKQFEINYGYRNPLNTILPSMNNANGDSPVAYFNQFGYLEIALPNYNISRMFSLAAGSIVSVSIKI